MSKKANELENTLKARGGVYGHFHENADVAQAIKDALRNHPGWDMLPATMREGLDLVALKMSRIVTGDWRHKDNPHDIAGYAKLMEDYCAGHQD